MEDSFRVRVDKVFGNLSTSTEPSLGDNPSLWCLTDAEIEKREWNRNKEVADEDGDEEEEEEEIIESVPSAVLNHPESDLNELSEEEEEVGEEIDRDDKKRRRMSSGSADDAGVEEYLDVQSNIGRDCTLDFEEEEDVYDKVAVGMEETGDRIYMKNVKHADYAIDEGDGFGELPNTFQDVVKDPRANHLAAKIRLKEDAEAAGDFGTLQLSDNHKKVESDVDNPKPILKKKEKPEPRSQKRVRFVLDPNSSSSTHEDPQQSSGIDIVPELRDDSPVAEQASDISQHSVGVPDYLRNPSKYVRYTFDSSDQLDEESNRKAYMEFFDHLRKGNRDASMEDVPIELPKSIVFTPKKKPDQDLRSEGGEHSGRENVETKRWSVGITAEETIESEVSAMEEDEPGPGEARGSQKSGRRYRKRASVDIVDNLD